MNRDLGGSWPRRSWSGWSWRGPELRLGLASAASLVLVYLWMAGRPIWTVYYLEVFPLLALVSAVGAGWLARLLGRLPPLRRQPAQAWVGLTILAGLAASVPGTLSRLARARAAQVDSRSAEAALQRAIDTIPGRAVVFVSPGPPDAPYPSFVRNAVDPARARIWVADDRGPDDARLMEMASDRAPYRYDPGTRTLVPWSRSLPGPAGPP